MLKKVFIILTLFSLICFTVNDRSDAFFKRNKAVKKQASNEAPVTEQKKILLVEIFASWCPGCKNIQPTLDQLVKEVADIDLIQLDVSTPSKAQASSKLAKELNITDFYNSNKSKTSTIGVIVRKSGEIVSLFENNNKLEDYKAAIEEAKTKDKALDNPPA